MEFPIWSISPFVLMLLCIAVLPMVIPHWWDKNRNKLLLSAAVSIPVLAVILPAAPHLLFDSLKDYFSFIVLLGALFVISAGIFIRGEKAGTPLVNTASPSNPACSSASSVARVANSETRPIERMRLRV